MERSPCRLPAASLSRLLTFNPRLVATAGVSVEACR